MPIMIAPVANSRVAAPVEERLKSVLLHAKDRYSDKKAEPLTSEQLKDIIRDNSLSGYWGRFWAAIGEGLFECLGYENSYSRDDETIYQILQTSTIVSQLNQIDPKTQSVWFQAWDANGDLVNL